MRIPSFSAILILGGTIFTPFIRGAVPAEVPTNGLVAYYPLNGTAEDASGNGHNGTVIGATATEGRFGTTNGAMFFNGTDNQIILPNLVPSYQSGLTMTCWMQSTDSIGSKGIVCLNRWSDSTGTAIALRLWQGQADAGFNNDAGGPIRENLGVSDTNVITGPAWNFLALTTDGSVLKLYVNGVFVGSTNYTDNGYASPANYRIGCEGVWLAGGLYNPFNGKVSDVAIYSRALSSGEINQIYTAPPPEPSTQITNTFTYTGAAQQWMVPTNVTRVYFDLRGASGGNAQTDFFVWGGVGSHVSGLINVTTGETLNFFVGGTGKTGWDGAGGGFNGGGNGIAPNGGGGGGATDIRLGGIAFDNVVAIAGGGGGGNGKGFGGWSAGMFQVQGTTHLQGNNGILPILYPYGYGGGGGGYYGGLGGGEYNPNFNQYPSSGCGGSDWAEPTLISAWTVWPISSGGNAGTSQLDGVVSISYGASPIATWRYAYFLSLSNNGSSADTYDYDQDGFSNLAEYAFGGDPKKMDVSLISPTVTPSGTGQFRVSFRCDVANTDISYIVQSANSPQSPTWTDIAQSAGGATTLPIGGLSTVSDSGVGLRNVTVTDTSSSANRFWRIKIVPSN